MQPSPPLSVASLRPGLLSAKFILKTASFVLFVFVTVSLAGAARDGGLRNVVGGGSAVGTVVPKLAGDMPGRASGRTAPHNLEPSQVRAIQAAASRSRPQARHIPAALTGRNKPIADATRRRRLRQQGKTDEPVRRVLDELEDTSTTVSLSSASSEPSSFTTLSELIKYTRVARLRTTAPDVPRLSGYTYSFRAINVYPFSTRVTPDLRLDSESAVEPDYQGISVDILKAIANSSAGDFTIRFTEPNSTQAGRRGALRDVSLGRADATVGPLTVLETNLPVVYTTPYMDTGLVLVTLISPPEAEVAISDMYSWMLPFTWEVWGMILAMIVVYSGVMYLLEQRSNSPDFASVEETGVHGLWKSTYLGMITFVGQLEGHVPATTIGRVLMQVTAFTAVILSSSYTANLATFLTASRTSTAYSITSIHDAQLLGSKVCVLAGSTAELVLTTDYNRIRQIQITGNTTEEMIDSGLQNLRNAACEGMVMDELMARAKISEPSGENCDIRIAGAVFLQQAYAVAVRKVGRASSDFDRLDGLVKTLNYYFTKMRIEGNLTRVYEESFVVSSPCKERAVDGNQIGPKQVMGPLVLFYSIAFVAIITKLVSLVYKKRREKRALAALNLKMSRTTE